MEKATSDPYVEKLFDTTIWIVLISVALVALVPTLQKIFSTTPTAMLYKGQQYLGLGDSRVLKATEDLQYVNLLDEPPYTAWITASFFNDGPHSVFIAINRPYGFAELKAGEMESASFVGGDRRIEIIYYMCNAGKTASVRAVGKY